MSRHQIDILNEKALDSVFIDLAESESLNKRALDAAEAEDYPKGIAWAVLCGGWIEMEKGLYDSSLKQIRRAERLFRDLKSDLRGLAASRNALGLVHIRLGRMRQAFLHLQDALDLCSRHGFKDLECTSLNYLGIHQYRSERYNQALRFFRKSLKLSTNRYNTSLFNNLGCTLRSLGRNEKALEWLNKALGELEREDKKGAKVSIYEELGLTYSQMGEYGKALEYLDRALAVSEGLQRRHRPDLLIHQAEQYINNGDFSRAEEILHQAEELIDDSNRVSHRKIHRHLSRIEEEKGNAAEALAHLKLYQELSESLRSTELDEEVWMLETEQYRSLNRRIASVAEMGRRLTAVLNRKDMIRILVNGLSTLFTVDSCAFGILDKEARFLDMQFNDLINGDVGYERLELDKERNLVSWCANRNMDLMINDLEDEIGDYLNRLDQESCSFVIRSALCSPFKSEGHRGVIGIYSSSTNSFNNEDREFLAMICSYAAIAMDNISQTELIRAKNRELVELNKFDGLTGIYNRRHILHRMEQNWKACRRNASFFHVLLLDADHFKAINDNHGHDAGDVCLKRLALILGESLQRGTDCYGRYGGEEFIISMQDMTPLDAADQAEKIRAAVEGASIRAGEADIRFTVSIGLCSYIPPRDEDCPDLKDVIKEADMNMYRSKSEGRNRISSSLFCLESCGNAITGY